MAALRGITWGSVREDGGGPEDPTDDVENGSKMGDNEVPTRNGFSLADPLKNVDEVARIVDNFLTGKRVERPPLLRGGVELSANGDLGVSVPAFPNLKPTATAWSEGGEERHAG